MGPVQEPDPIEQGLTELGGAPPEEGGEPPEQDPNAQVMEQALVVVTQQEVMDIIPEATKDQVNDIAVGVLSGDVQTVVKAVEAAIMTRDRKRKEKMIGIKLQFKGTSTSNREEYDRNFGMSEEEAGEYLRSNVRQAGY